MRSYVFPGQGVQKKGMGRGLFEEFPELCRRADEILGYSIETLCLENPDRRLSRTEYAQPAIYVVNALHYLAACRQDPPVDYLAGHSLGEYDALLAAGVFDFDAGLTVVKRRAELMGRADGGGMAAVVGVSAEVIEETLTTHGATDVVIANHNAPEQFVLSGSADELKRIRPVFEALDGVRGFAPLRASGAFHSPWMRTAATEFREFLDSVEVGEPRTPVVSNVTGRPFEPGAHAVRDSLAAQITRPVQWVECVRYLRDAGVTDFVELGGSTVLTSLIDQITDQVTAEEHPAGGEREAMIARIRREVLLPEVGDAALRFDENESFRRLGMDSIVYVRLARKVQAVFGVPFKPDVLYKNRTCAALADYLLASPGVPNTEPPDTAPWREYRDERVLALLRDCANGIRDVDEVVETIRGGVSVPSSESRPGRRSTG
ncbi:MAG TPA: ACP S-malonyltransferase [Actinophytocola sp.]|nr:ACP S-malonyltransferase [Actinophytocola sp.]